MTKILIVDDDPDQRELLRRCLEPVGYTVVEAATVAEGKRQILNRPDCLITDLRLPNGCGEQVVIDLLHSKDVPVPAIVCTSYPQDLTILRGMIVSLLPKPWEPEQLLRRVARALAMREDLITFCEYSREIETVCKRVEETL